MNEFRPAKYAIPLGFCAFGSYLFLTAKPVFFPFILAATVAYLVNPLIGRLERRGVRRLNIVIGIYFVFVGVLAVGGTRLTGAVRDEAGRLSTDWPLYKKKLKLVAARADKYIDRLPVGAPVVRDFVNKNTDAMFSWLQTVPGYLFGFVPLLTLSFLVPFIAFFFMLEGPNLLQRGLDVLPSRYIEMALHILCKVDESLGNYVRGIMTQSLVLSLLALTGLLFLGIDYAVVLALFVGLSNLIPYLGPFLGAIAAGIAAFAQFGDPMVLGNIVILFTLLQFVDNWVLQPIILKRAVDMHPLVILFVLMLAGEVWGFSGLIFAVPVAGVLKVLAHILWEWHQTEFGWRREPTPAELKVPIV